MNGDGTVSAPVRIGGPRDRAAWVATLESADAEGFEPDVIVVGGGSAGRRRKVPA